jgi:hypothetical protein
MKKPTFRRAVLAAGLGVAVLATLGAAVPHDCDRSLFDGLEGAQAAPAAVSAGAADAGEDCPRAEMSARASR